jgi:3-oxoacyl-[acyl-carrier protein] reductase
LQSFEGVRVLVTGAGRGIGKRLAIGFAGSGAKVGLLARSKAELDLTQLEIDHAGGTAIRLRADVRQLDQVQAAADRMRAQFGGVDVLIHAAAIQGPIGPFLKNPLEQWWETVSTNLQGAIHCAHVLLPEMVARRHGKIVFLSGGGGTKPRPNFTAYAASKAALLRFAETLADEVRDHNVQVNCMSPGGTYTHMTDEILRAGEAAGERDYQEALEVRLTGGTPLEKQIQLAMFLASERSNHISGKLIHVHDDWRRLEGAAVNPELFTLRRIQKV